MTAFWRRLPFLFFQVQLFPVLCHTVLHPWTAKWENQQNSVSHLIITDWMDNGADHAAIIALCANCNTVSVQPQSSAYLFAIPVPCFHWHCSLRHISENRVTYLGHILMALHSISIHYKILLIKIMFHLALRGSSTGHKSALQHWWCFHLECWIKHLTDNGQFIMLELHNKSNPCINSKLTSWQ